MRSTTISSQGFELSWLVPETVDEYNSLAPKRANPCLEDAVSLIFLHSAATTFRDRLSTKLAEVTGIKPEEDETEGKHIKRVFVEEAKKRGLDPAAKSTRDALVAEWTPLAQAIMSAIKFDPSVAERTGVGPKLAKLHIGWAEKAVLKDGGVELAALLGKVLNTTIELTGTNEEKVITLAKAIAANEKRKRDAQAEKDYDPTA